MFKIILHRLKLGLLPSLVICFISGLIVGIIALVCVSNIFDGIIGILLLTYMIYIIGESRDKK